METVGPNVQTKFENSNSILVLFECLSRVPNGVRCDSIELNAHKKINSYLFEITSNYEC